MPQPSPPLRGGEYSTFNISETRFVNGRNDTTRQLETLVEASQIFSGELSRVASRENFTAPKYCARHVAGCRHFSEIPTSRHESLNRLVKTNVAPLSHEGRTECSLYLDLL